MTLRASLRRFVRDEYTPTQKSLGIFRLVFAVWCLVLLPPRYQWIAQFPASFLNPPPGLTYFFVTGFPPLWFFVALDVTIIAALVYLIAGRRVRLASLVLAGCLLLGNAWAYSFGKIDHDILLVLTPIFLLGAGWEGRGSERGWPLALFALIIALAMFTAAFQKAITGWLDVASGATLGHIVRNAVVHEKGYTPVWFFVVRKLPHVVWEIMDYGTVLLEASFVLTFFKRRAFKVTCAIACLFHLGIGLLMQLLFISNLAAYGAFVEWEKVADRLRIRDTILRLQAWLTRLTDFHLLASAAILSVVTLTWENPLNWLAQSLVPGGPALALTWIAAVGGATLLMSEVRSLQVTRALTPSGSQ